LLPILVCAMHPRITTSASAAGEATERRRTVCRGLPRRQRREGSRGPAQTPWPHLSSRAGPRPGDCASIRDHMLAHHDRHQPGRLHRPHATWSGSGSQTGNPPCKSDFRVSGEDMTFWIAAFLLIPIADQAIKALLRQRLGDRVASLGPLGSLRVIDAPIWWARGGLRPTLVMLWIAWLARAGARGAGGPGHAAAGKRVVRRAAPRRIVEPFDRDLATRTRLRLPVPALLAGIQFSRRRDLDRHRRLHRPSHLRVGRSLALT